MKQEQIPVRILLFLLRFTFTFCCCIAVTSASASANANGPSGNKLRRGLSTAGVAMTISTIGGRKHETRLSRADANANAQDDPHESEGVGEKEHRRAHDDSNDVHESNTGTSHSGRRQNRNNIDFNVHTNNYIQRGRTRELGMSKKADGYRDGYRKGKGNGWGRRVKDESSKSQKKSKRKKPLDRNSNSMSKSKKVLNWKNGKKGGTGTTRSSNNGKKNSHGHNKKPMMASKDKNDNIFSPDVASAAYPSQAPAPDIPTIVVTTAPSGEILSPRGDTTAPSQIAQSTSSPTQAPVAAPINPPVEGEPVLAPTSTYSPTKRETTSPNLTPSKDPTSQPSPSPSQQDDTSDPTTNPVSNQDQVTSNPTESSGSAPSSIPNVPRPSASMFPTYAVSFDPSGQPSSEKDSNDSIPVSSSRAPTTIANACPEVPDGGCSVCGESSCVTAPDIVVTFPGQPPVSCGQLQEDGLSGSINPERCALLSDTALNVLCRCSEAVSQPPLSPSPTLVAVSGSQNPSSQYSSPPTTSLTGNATRPPASERGGEPFFCNICGDGFVIANPGALVSPPNEDDIFCFALADQGSDGLIPPDRCDQLVPLVEASCGCTPRYSTCLSCGVGSTIINPNGIIEFFGQPSFTCHQVVQAGFLGVIPSAQCAPLVPIILENCGCQDVGEEVPCQICGEGFEVINVNATVNLPGLQEVTCGNLSQGKGLVDPAWCPYLTPFVFEPCGCQRASFFPSCSVCGDGSRVTNTTTTVSVLGQSKTCGEIQADGIDGFFSPDVCQAATLAAEASCGCQLDECQQFPRCNVCGEGRVVSNRNATLLLPGQQMFSCGEFADLGGQCRLDPAFCPASVSFVESVCGCEEGAVTSSAVPSVNPIASDVPTQRPSITSNSTCTSTESGNFGTTEGDPSAAVDYLYMVEVEQSVSLRIFLDEIVSKIEVQSTNAIIPNLFLMCGFSSSRRVLQTGIIGISSSPKDIIIDGTCDETLLSPTNACFVVSGSATLFFTPAADVNSLMETATTSVLQSMARGELNNVDPRVVRVAPQTSDLNASADGSIQQSQQRVPSYAWVIIAIGATLPVLITGLVCYRRNRNGESTTEFPQEPTSISDRFLQEFSAAPGARRGRLPTSVSQQASYDNRSGQMRDASASFRYHGADAGGRNTRNYSGVRDLVGLGVGVGVGVGASDGEIETSARLLHVVNSDESSHEAQLGHGNTNDSFLSSDRIF